MASSDHERMLHSRKEMYKAGGFKDKVKEIEKETRQHKKDVKESHHKGGEEVFKKLQAMGEKKRLEKESKRKSMKHSKG